MGLVCLLSPTREAKNIICISNTKNQSRSLFLYPQAKHAIRRLPSTCFPAAAVAAALRVTFDSGELDRLGLTNWPSPADAAYAEVSALLSDPIYN